MQRSCPEPTGSFALYERLVIDGYDYRRQEGDARGVSFCFFLFVSCVYILRIFLSLVTSTRNPDTAGKREMARH